MHKENGGEKMDAMFIVSNVSQASFARSILNSLRDAIVAIFPAINPPTGLPSYKFPRLRDPRLFFLPNARSH